MEQLTEQELTCGVVHTALAVGIGLLAMWVTIWCVLLLVHWWRWRHWHKALMKNNARLIVDGGTCAPMPVRRRFKVR